MPVLMTEMTIFFKGNFFTAMTAPNGTPIKTAMSVEKTDTYRDIRTTPAISGSRLSMRAIPFINPS